MKSTSKAVFLACAMAFVAGTACADPAQTAIYGLPTDKEVTLSGTVDQVGTNDHRFVLRNDQGTIDVSLPADKTMPLHVGDSVTVTGMVKKPLMGVLGSEIKATSVEHRRNS